MSQRTVCAMAKGRRTVSVGAWMEALWVRDEQESIERLKTAAKYKVYESNARSGALRRNTRCRLSESWGFGTLAASSTTLSVTKCIRNYRAAASQPFDHWSGRESSFARSTGLDDRLGNAEWSARRLRACGLRRIQCTRCRELDKS